MGTELVWYKNLPCFNADCHTPPPTGRAEFVLLRTLTEVTLPLLHGLELVSQPKGAIPVLVGEVKTAAAFDQHIWQPLAGALELMNRSAAPPDSMWWVPFLSTLPLHSVFPLARTHEMS